MLAGIRRQAWCAPVTAGPHVGSSRGPCGPVCISSCILFSVAAGRLEEDAPPPCSRLRHWRRQQLAAMAAAAEAARVQALSAAHSRLQISSSYAACSKSTHAGVALTPAAWVAALEGAMAPGFQPLPRPAGAVGRRQSPRLPAAGAADQRAGAAQQSSVRTARGRWCRCRCRRAHGRRGRSSLWR